MDRIMLTQNFLFFFFPEVFLSTHLRSQSVLLNATYYCNMYVGYHSKRKHLLDLLYKYKNVKGTQCS